MNGVIRNILKNAVVILGLVIICQGTAEAKRRKPTVCPRFVAINGIYAPISGAQCFDSAAKAEKSGAVPGSICLGGDCSVSGEPFSLSGGNSAEAISDLFTVARSAKVTYTYDVDPNKHCFGWTFRIWACSKLDRVCYDTQDLLSTTDDFSADEQDTYLTKPGTWVLWVRPGSCVSSWNVDVEPK
jgi:hypothetical protein